MTTRALHVIWSPEDRAHLARVIMDPQRVPDGTRIEFRGKSRTGDQNSLMWVLLTFISENVEWHGVKLDADDWKTMFIAKLKKLRIVPNLDGDGFVALGGSTSTLRKEEFSDLIEAIYEFIATAQLELPPAGPPKRMLAAPPLGEKERVF